MAILTFSARAVAAQIAHARSCSTFLPNWDGPVGTPALILIVGNGVHLRYNGIDGTTTRIVTTERADPSYTFAEGINPFRDAGWMAARQAAFRDLTGQFYTDILDDVQMLIDRGQGTIRLATDGHSIRVFVRRASDFLIGGAYDVTSGLGGTSTPTAASSPMGTRRRKSPASAPSRPTPARRCFSRPARSDRPGTPR